MSLRILNVNDTLDLKTGGGTAERTFQMSRHLARYGAHCEVLTLNSEQLTKQRMESLKPAIVFTLPRLWKRFNVPSWNFRMIYRLVKHADVLHLMGHWGILNALVYFVAQRLKKPYVVCPAGALPLFGRSRRLKRIYNFLIGKAIVRNASGWIAVTQGEFSQFEAYGIPASSVTVIPNGVSEEDFPVVDTAGFRRRHGLSDVPCVLFMGRLNLIKGPDLLLEAFVSVREKFPNFHLVFAGPDGGMLSALQETADQRGVAEFVHFIGYVEGADKVAAYRMATLLVVPSRQEAMSIVAIEAGFCGTPVLLTDQCGFSDVRSIDARLEVPATVDGIADGLANLLGDAGKLAEISPVWSDFVTNSYSWSALVPAYFRLYRSILGAAAG